MSMSRFWNFVLPPARIFNSGSRAVSELVNLNKPETSSTLSFQERHNLSSDQFALLSDVLSSDLKRARALAGSRYYDYAEHIDYKLRSASLPRVGSTYDSIANLRKVYSGYEEALKPNDVQVQVLEELRAAFLVRHKEMDISRWGSAEFNSIGSNLNEIENRLSFTLEQHQQGKLKHCCERMRESLENDGFNFVVDSLSYINFQLATVEEDSSLVITEGNSLEESLTREWEQRQLAQITMVNKRALEVYNNEDENYAHLVSAECLPASNYFIFASIGGVAGASWLYAVATGTGTYTFLMGVPFVYHYFARGWYNESYNNRMEVVKDIFLRKADGNLDVYFYKGGSYTRGLEGV